MFVDEIDFRWKVVNCHLMEAEVPVFLIAVGHADMMTAVSVASRIPQPHVVAEISQNERESLLRSTQNPIGGAGENSMLEEDGLLGSIATPGATAWNAMNVQYVTVFCDHRMTFS